MLSVYKPSFGEVGVPYYLVPEISFDRVAGPAIFCGAVGFRFIFGCDCGNMIGRLEFAVQVAALAIFHNRLCLLCPVHFARERPVDRLGRARLDRKAEHGEKKQVKFIHKPLKG